MAPFVPPSERLRTRFARVDSSRREILLATVALAVVIAVGTFGGRMIEGWPLDGWSVHDFHHAVDDRIR